MFLGIALDAGRNAASGEYRDIGSTEAPVRTLVAAAREGPTDRPGGQASARAVMHARSVRARSMAASWLSVGAGTRGCPGEARFHDDLSRMYSGRSVHIRLKIRLFHNGRERHEFTSQLFFDQDVVEDIPHDPRCLQGPGETGGYKMTSTAPMVGSSPSHHRGWSWRIRRFDRDRPLKSPSWTPS